MTLDQDSDYEILRGAIYCIEGTGSSADDDRTQTEALAALDRIAALREAEEQRDEARKSVDELQDDLVNVVAADIAERNRYREVLEGFVAWERSDFSTSDELVRHFMLARAALEPKESE